MNLLEELPCAVLVTDGMGRVQATNAALLALAGGQPQDWLNHPMDALFPPAGRIFLQTHIWPMLLADGSVREVYLQLRGASPDALFPVLLNGRRGSFEGREAYFWTIFVAQQRSRFEADLLRARERAEASTQALADSDRFIKTLADSMTGPLAYWDKNLRCVYANKPSHAWFGRHPEELIGAHLQDVLSASAYAVVEPYVHAALAGQPQQFERTLLRADGLLWHTLTNYVPDLVAGEVVGFLAQISDITALKNTEAALRQEMAEREGALSLLRVTLQSIGDAVITTGADGRVAWLNPEAERLTGWLAADAKGCPLGAVFLNVDEASRLCLEDPVQACLVRGQTLAQAAQTLLIARDGSECGIEHSAAPIRTDTGEVLGLVLVFRDVSEQRRMSGEMRYRATHDALTGLVNRVEFEAHLQRLLRRAHDDQSVHAMLYIDLDQFKLVNDACGHAVGDLLLQQVSKLLGEAIRVRDTLARLGGDEFGILLENCSAEQAQRVAQKVCDSMDDFRLVHEDRRFRIGTSVGLVPVDQRWSTPAAIHQAADSACYAAKEAGRNRVHAWFDTDAAMRARHFEMQWTTRIERALDDDGFVLFAQRIAPLQGNPQGTAQGVHAEVLLRLANADGSLAPPGAFLPAAERFNLIGRVDRWVLRHAVAWLQAVPADVVIDFLSVNLSGLSVGDRSFHAWATDLLTSAGASVRERLCLEVTETAAVTNLADAATFIDSVRRAGVRVALDDFGAGASSFGYLKSLPVDILKIDGQFIRDLVTDPLNDAAVRCFVDVARLVGVKTVAEFVDDPAVRQRLHEIGVDFAQGYLIHKPEPIDCLLRPVVQLVDA